MKKCVLNIFLGHKEFLKLSKQKQSDLIDQFRISQSLATYEDWMSEIVKEDEDVTEEQSEAISKIQAINFLQKYKF